MLDWKIWYYHICLNMENFLMNKNADTERIEIPTKYAYQQVLK